MVANLRARHHPRQSDDEGCSISELAGDADVTSMSRHDLLRDPQPEPHAPVALRRDEPGEATKEQRLAFGRDPWPLIFHREFDIHVRGADAYVDRLLCAELE